MYHLNYFEFMVQQRVQILIKYVVCMGATTLLNNNMAVLFKVLTSWGRRLGVLLWELTLVLCSWAHIKCTVLPQLIFPPREVIERRALQTFLILINNRSQSPKNL